MSIQAERIVLDTTVWIFGLHQDRNHPGCSELLEKPRALQVIIPRQVLVDLLDRYRRLGCLRGDATVAALTEHVGATALVTENREFFARRSGSSVSRPEQF